MYKKSNFKLVSIIKILLWIIVGWKIGELISNAINSSSLDYKVINENRTQQKHLNLVNLFGESNGKKVLPTDIKIIGLVAGATDGSIIISFKEGPNQVIKLGKKSKDGLVFEGFFNNFARFKFEEKVIEVPYVVSKKFQEKKIDPINISI